MKKVIYRKFSQKEVFDRVRQDKVIDRVRQDKLINRDNSYYRSANEIKFDW